MSKIAHVMYTYLGQSETFIWQYIQAAHNTYPVIIADLKENIDQFPIPRGKLYTTYGKRLSYKWFIDNWYRRVLNRSLGYPERIIRKQGAQLIHSHFGPVGCKYLTLSVALKIPLVTNFYGADLSIRNMINKHRADYYKLFELGTHFLVEGPFMRDKLISIGCPEEKISIQRIALDLEKYRFKSHLTKPKNSKKILFVGRFVEKKGLEYAIRALAELKRDFIFEFRVIGSGQLENKLQQLAIELGLRNEIKWLGTKTHKTVIRELHDCDLVLQPSVTAKNGDSEGGAPTIILEAQACGVPIISTYHADIPNITCQGESALLSPEKDIKNLSHSIRYLLENPDLRMKLGKRGRQYVRQYHDIKNEIIALEEIYKNCIAEYGKRTNTGVSDLQQTRNKMSFKTINTTYN